MEKLKNKIFWVIFSMLTIFLISILCITNFQNYNHEKTQIENNLNKMEDDRKKEEPTNKEQKEDTKPEEKVQDNNIQEPQIFMDTIAYTVFYNDENEVIDIINHSQSEISDDEIKTIGESILKSESEKNTKIGNLYFDKYSYSYKGHNSLTIIDNQKVQAKLIALLETSIAIFIFLELIILVVTLKITSWIIKPVIESFNKQKQFIEDASHELKTPIAVIMANAEELENEPNEAKWLNNIKSESERMSELVSQLLDLAKLENKELKIEYTDNDLSKIIERTVLTFESLMYENNIKLDYKISENIKFKCNSIQMKQLVAILLDNAIKHSSENGEIKVLLTKEKNNIVLQVSNKGKEISKEIQEKIFERFYRADESRNRDSKRYGLGLAIAKNIVTNHNGKISVKSENGYTTFTVKM